MVTLVAYVLGTVFFMALDYAQWPHFLYKYKINPGKNAPPEKTKVIKVRKTLGIKERPIKMEHEINCAKLFLPLSGMF